MTPPPADPFDVIVARVAPGRRDRRIIEAFGPALEGALELLPVVPAVYLVAGLLRLAVGAPPFPLPIAAVLGATVALPLLVLLLRLVYVHLQPLDGRTSIAMADAAVGAGERLLTAHEFASRTDRTSFEQAAIDDAHPYVERALTDPVRVARGRVDFDPLRVGRRVAAAASLLLLSMLCAGWAPSADEPTAPRVARDVAQLVEPDRPQIEAADSDPRDDRPPPAQPEKRDPDRREAEATARTHATGLTSQIKESEGKTGSGQSSNAESISGQSDSQGAPSNQAQSTKQAAANKLGAQKPNKKDKTPPASRSPRKELNETSGATAGRGSSKGSSKNPATTDWSSKDQVTTPDDDELPVEEEVEDENEDSDARGGLQPSLRDRRPPVSRDLQIGFGNGKNPDANGRGGPSARKKSRGTASLVLGVPIPDRIKGQPNPGKTKITQERVKPREEESIARAGKDRVPRAAPVGHVASPDLPPWMRRLVRSYFQSLRESEIGTP